MSLENRLSVRFYEPNNDAWEPRLVLSILVEGFSHGTAELLESIGKAIESGKLGSLIAEIENSDIRDSKVKPNN